VRAIPNKDMSIIHATNVVIAASPVTRVMNTVPERWCAMPHRPNKNAIPAKPAAIGCKMSVFVRLYMTVDSSWEESKFLGTLKWYPMLALLPVYPKTPKCVVLDLELTSRKDIFSHVGEETEAKTSRTAAERQRNAPGIAWPTGISRRY